MGALRYSLSLSLDNLLAGTGMGMLGFPPVFTAAVFGAMTALTTFLGLQLGGVVARFIPVRADLLSGIGLSVMAVVLALGYCTYGQPAPGAGAWAVRIRPVRSSSAMVSGPRHSLATMKSVLLSVPPSAQAKHPRSSSIF